MPETDLVSIFINRLEAAGVEYMVSGSVAAMIYGEPRFTNDVDIIVHLGSTDVMQLTAAFPLEFFYCPPEEVLLIESRRKHRGHFNLIHHDSGYKADMYFHGDDPLHVWGFRNRRRLKVSDGHGLWAAPPEYVILRKLEYYREGGSDKHKRDICAMMDVSGDDIDCGVIDEWALKLGLQKEWSEISSLF